MTLLDLLDDEQRLLDAWRRVREQAYEDGEAGEAVTQFERDAAARVASIARELHEGRWQPSPVVHVAIPKGDGTFRNLGIPSIDDRIVERVLVDLLDPIIDPLLLPWSFAYRRGLGVRDALRSLVNAKDRELNYVVRTDVKDCFEQIPRWPLVQRLAEVVDDPPVVDLVAKLLNRRLVGKRAPRLPRGRGLHQGSPLSPLLANLYLDRLDRDLLDDGWVALRFADDIAIPAGSRREAESALQVARDSVRQLDLELNMAKTRVLTFDEGVPFLGQTITATSGALEEPTVHPLEATVFVTRPGAWVRSRGKRLVVQDGSEVLLRVHMNRVRQVVTVGRVGITAAALQQTSRMGIDVVVLQDHGRLTGRFSGPQNHDPRARIAQHEQFHRAGRRLDLAQAFVRGKAINMRACVLKSMQPGKADRDDERRMEHLRGQLRRTMSSLDSGIGGLRTASSLDAVRGNEGMTSRAYLHMAIAIVPSEWSFTGRNRRPPLDPVNSMLSFGYSLLAEEALAACVAAGLDPDVGFLHDPKVGRPSLALDLMEEFRPVVVDAAVLRIVRRRMVRPEDFIVTEQHGCRMDDRSRRVFLTAYERRMLTAVRLREHPRPVGWRTALHLQAKQLARALRSDGPYIPIRWR